MLKSEQSGEQLLEIAKKENKYSLRQKKISLICPFVYNTGTSEALGIIQILNKVIVQLGA